MAENITGEGLTAKLTQLFEDYTDDVTKKLKQQVTKTANELREDLKSTSPKDTGNYAKGWTTRKTEDAGSISITAYNKNKPHITHLLENGHAKQSGGRTAAIPHIKPAEAKAEKQLEARVKAVLSE